MTCDFGRELDQPWELLTLAIIDTFCLGRPCPDRVQGRSSLPHQPYPITTNLKPNHSHCRRCPRHAGMGGQCLSMVIDLVVIHRTNSPTPDAPRYTTPRLGLRKPAHLNPAPGTEVGLEPDWSVQAHWFTLRMQCIFWGGVEVAFGRGM